MKTKAVTCRVTRKGQVTIPVEFRKVHHIREGGKVVFSSAKDGGLVLTAVPNLEDLAGADSGIISYRDAVKRLDRLRENDRY